MAHEPERRGQTRLNLRLRVVRLEQSGPIPGAGLWTNDISGGGMYVLVPTEQAAPLKVGDDLLFELALSPGAGYSATPGSIRGKGKVLRREPKRRNVTGLAMQFTTPLAMDFRQPSAQA